MAEAPRAKTDRKSAMRWVLRKSEFGDDEMRQRRPIEQFWIKFTNGFNMIIHIGAALRLFVVVINICNLITTTAAVINTCNLITW